MNAGWFQVDVTRTGRNRPSVLLIWADNAGDVVRRVPVGMTVGSVVAR